MKGEELRKREKKSELRRKEGKEREIKNVRRDLRLWRDWRALPLQLLLCLEPVGNHPKEEHTPRTHLSFTAGCENSLKNPVSVVFTFMHCHSHYLLIWSHKVKLQKCNQPHSILHLSTNIYARPWEMCQEISAEIGQVGIWGQYCWNATFRGEKPTTMVKYKNTKFKYLTREF